MNEFATQYKKKDGKLFIDSSKKMLNGDLLVHTKETPNIILRKMNYTTSAWVLCGGLKVFIIFGHQNRITTTFLYVICEWNNRARDQQLYKKQWPLRKTLTTAEKNILERF